MKEIIYLIFWLKGLKYKAKLCYMWRNILFPWKIMKKDIYRLFKDFIFSSCSLNHKLLRIGMRNQSYMWKSLKKSDFH